MTASMVHVTNRVTPGMITLQSKHQLMTVSMVNVTNLTPGSDENPTIVVFVIVVVVFIHRVCCGGTLGRALGRAPPLPPSDPHKLRVVVGVVLHPRAEQRHLAPAPRGVAQQVARESKRLKPGDPM
jgi:hypothetical protein